MPLFNLDMCTYLLACPVITSNVINFDSHKQASMVCSTFFCDRIGFIATLVSHPYFVFFLCPYSSLLPPLFSPALFLGQDFTGLYSHKVTFFCLCLLLAGVRGTNHQGLFILLLRVYFNIYIFSLKYMLDSLV